MVNAGSSSLKFQIFDVAGGAPERRVRGQIDGIGARPRLKVADAAGAVLADRRFEVAEIPDLPAAISAMRAWLDGLDGFAPRAIGHRVVHGGPDFAAPVRIDAQVLERLAAFQDLAPLHQPNNLAPIRLAMEIDPALPQVACFDTAFHRGGPPVAEVYAVPPEFADAGLRRYGFHGLSYEYVAGRLREVAPEIADGRVIVAHLGAGASMCALRDGRSVETTMGFTALDGLPMATRPGRLDPGAVLWMISQRGMSPDEVSDMLYRRSGLKGLSGLSGDMRELLASEAPRAAFAVEHFVHRCALEAGMLTAALGGLDAVAFTAGVGENSAEIRARIAERMGWQGVVLDPEANAAGAARISTDESRVTLLVTPTDEELVIARHTLDLLG